MIYNNIRFGGKPVDASTREACEAQANATNAATWSFDGSCTTSSRAYNMEYASGVTSGVKAVPPYIIGSLEGGEVTLKCDADDEFITSVTVDSDGNYITSIAVDCKNGGTNKISPLNITALSDGVAVTGLVMQGETTYKVGAGGRIFSNYSCGEKINKIVIGHDGKRVTRVESVGCVKPKAPVAPACPVAPKPPAASASSCVIS